MSQMCARKQAKFSTGACALIIAGCAILAACSSSEPSSPPSQTQQPANPSPASTPTAAPPPVIAAAAPAPLRSEVPLEADSGTFLIPVTINDTISLKFTIDSGASDVTIPSDVATTLIRAGTISADDYIGSQTFVLADGSQVPSPEFRIRSLRVGNVMLHNVVASITGTEGGLLLGQTFLRRLKSWSIDNGRHVLVLEANSDENMPPPTEEPVRSVTTTEVAQNNQPQTGLGSSPLMEGNAEETVRQYFAAWSDPSDPDGQAVRQYYGDSVSFYGKQVGVAELMSGEKLRFARRWPVRSYTIRANSIHAKCTLGTPACTVTGIVDWSVSSPTTFRHSSGAARFSLLLDGNHIVGEGGKVISRN